MIDERHSLMTQMTGDSNDYLMAVYSLDYENIIYDSLMTLWGLHDNSMMPPWQIILLFIPTWLLGDFLIGNQVNDHSKYSDTFIDF